MTKEEYALDKLAIKEYNNSIIRKVYKKVCENSGYELHWEDAALITADMLNIYPLDVGLAFPRMMDLNIIALGRHPSTQVARIKDET